jgi:Xaa-Pro aminopeptidase
MHHYALAALLPLAAGLCVWGAPPRLETAGIPVEEYAERRQKLRAQLADGLVVIAGATEPERGSLRSRFRQESNFLYLTGWQEPGAFLILSPEEEFFFLPARSENRERYTGRKVAPDDAGARAATGFANILAYDLWEQVFRELASKRRTVYVLEDDPLKEQLKGLADLEIRDLSLPLARLRMVKSAREIGLIRRSVAASVEAHRAAWRRVSPGLFEYQIAATIMNSYFEAGCERNAYPPIVASGPAAVILHYNENKRRMERGDLLLVDAGAECSYYAADITRTLPVSGRFTPRQRELYEIVLGAQKAAIAAAKPGMMLRGSGEKSLEQIATSYIGSRGGARDGEPLTKYFTHGLGHHVGLDVHDATDPSLELAPGMVVTIEPGLYIPEEGVGIRIEDMILITVNGAEVLSSALPKEAREIEDFLSKRKR